MSSQRTHGRDARATTGPRPMTLAAYTFVVLIGCYATWLVALNARSLRGRRRDTAAAAARWAALSVMLGLGAAAASPASAHFVFVVPEPDASKAKVVFSEDLEADEDVDIKLIGGT